MDDFQFHPFNLMDKMTKKNIIINYTSDET